MIKKSGAMMKIEDNLMEPGKLHNSDIKKTFGLTVGDMKKGSGDLEMMPPYHHMNS